MVQRGPGSGPTAGQIFIELVLDERQFDQQIRRLQNRVRQALGPLSGTIVDRPGARQGAVGGDLGGLGGDEDTARQLGRLLNYLERSSALSRSMGAEAAGQLPPFRYDPALSTPAVNQALQGTPAVRLREGDGEFRQPTYRVFEPNELRGGGGFGYGGQTDAEREAQFASVRRLVDDQRAISQQGIETALRVGQAYREFGPTPSALRRAGINPGLLSGGFSPIAGDSGIARFPQFFSPEYFDLQTGLPNIPARLFAGVRYSQSSGFSAEQLFERLLRPFATAPIEELAQARSPAELGRARAALSRIQQTFSDPSAVAAGELESFIADLDRTSGVLEGRVGRPALTGAQVVQQVLDDTRGAAYPDFRLPSLGERVTFRGATFTRRQFQRGLANLDIPDTFPSPVGSFRYSVPSGRTRRSVSIPVFSDEAARLSQVADFLYQEEQQAVDRALSGRLSGLSIGGPDSAFFDEINRREFQELRAAGYTDVEARRLFAQGAIEQLNVRYPQRERIIALAEGRLQDGRILPSRFSADAVQAGEELRREAAIALGEESLSARQVYNQLFNIPVGSRDDATPYSPFPFDSGDHHQRAAELVQRALQLSPALYNPFAGESPPAISFSDFRPRYEAILAQEARRQLGLPQVRRQARPPTERELGLLSQSLGVPSGQLDFSNPNVLRALADLRDSPVDAYGDFLPLGDEYQNRIGLPAPSGAINYPTERDFYVGTRERGITPALPSVSAGPAASLPSISLSAQAAQISQVQARILERFTEQQRQQQFESQLYGFPALAGIQPQLALPPGVVVPGRPIPLGGRVPGGITVGPGDVAPGLPGGGFRTSRVFGAPSPGTDFELIRNALPAAGTETQIRAGIGRIFDSIQGAFNAARDSIRDGIQRERDAGIFTRETEGQRRAFDADPATFITPDGQVGRIFYDATGRRVNLFGDATPGEGLFPTDPRYGATRQAFGGGRGGGPFGGQRGNAFLGGSVNVGGIAFSGGLYDLVNNPLVSGGLYAGAAANLTLAQPALFAAGQTLPLAQQVTRFLFPLEDQRALLETVRGSVQAGVTPDRLGAALEFLPADISLQDAQAYARATGEIVALRGQEPRSTIRLLRAFDESQPRGGGRVGELTSFERTLVSRLGPTATEAIASESILRQLGSSGIDQSQAFALASVIFEGEEDVERIRDFFQEVTTLPQARRGGLAGRDLFTDILPTLARRQDRERDPELATLIDRAFEVEPSVRAIIADARQPGAFLQQQRNLQLLDATQELASTMQRINIEFTRFGEETAAITNIFARGGESVLRIVNRVEGGPQAVGIAGTVLGGGFGALQSIGYNPGDALEVGTGVTAGAAVARYAGGLIASAVTSPAVISGLAGTVSASILVALGNVARQTINRAGEGGLRGPGIHQDIPTSDPSAFASSSGGLRAGDLAVATAFSSSGLGGFFAAREFGLDPTSTLVYPPGFEGPLLPGGIRAEGPVFRSEIERAAAVSSDGFEPGEVVEVIDADTVRVRLPSGREEILRLRGLDAPELGSLQGNAAALSARNVYPPGTQIEFRPARVDDYGRFVSDVRFPGDIATLNRQFIQQGIGEPRGDAFPNLRRQFPADERFIVDPRDFRRRPGRSLNPVLEGEFYFGGRGGVPDAGFFSPVDLFGSLAFLGSIVNPYAGARAGFIDRLSPGDDSFLSFVSDTLSDYRPQRRIRAFLPANEEGPLAPGQQRLRGPSGAPTVNINIGTIGVTDLEGLADALRVLGVDLSEVGRYTRPSVTVGATVNNAGRLGVV